MTLRFLGGSTGDGGGGGGLDPAASPTLTGEWTFDPPVEGTIDEFGASDTQETTPITLKPKAVGTAALNIIKYDDTPPDGSGYGVAHIDSDGGFGFAGDRVTCTEAGHVIIDGGPGNAALNVKQEGTLVFAAGSFSAMFVASAATTQPGLSVGTYTDQTADAIEVYEPSVDAMTFRVTPAGEVHAAGGVVLKSPDGTAYRLIVANGGALSTEAV